MLVMRSPAQRAAGSRKETLTPEKAILNFFFVETAV